MSESGLRVVVTPGEDGHGELSLALIGRGFVPIACPVLIEEPPREPAALEAATRELERFDWMIVASARAVAAVMRARDGRALPPGLSTAAVGPKTAARLVEHGAVDPLVATESGATPLIEALRDADAWPGRRVFVPRADGGRPELGEALRSWGAEVTDVIAYRMRPHDLDDIRRAWTPEAWAAVVGSSSAARALVGAIEVPALRRLEHVVAIGRTTRDTLLELGVPSVMPAVSDYDRVAELLGTLAASARKEQTL